MPTDRKSRASYEHNADVWLRKKGLGHTHLEKPAMYAAVGSVRGKRILCLGCGAGEECAHLLRIGASRVVGIDTSRTLIEKAKRDVPKAEFHVMDMERLRFPAASFDIVYSSLALHYVGDWTPVLRATRRVLEDGGLFVFSTHHPVFWGAAKKEERGSAWHILGHRKEKDGRIVTYGDYLHARKINDVWYDSFKVTYYHRPLSALFSDILRSGFSIEAFLEPGPIPSARRADPAFWDKNSKVPLFAIFRLRK